MYHYDSQKSGIVNGKNCMLSECSEEERARYEEFIQECGLGIHW